MQGHYWICFMTFPRSCDSAGTRSQGDFSHQLDQVVLLSSSEGGFGTWGTHVISCLSQLLRQCRGSCGTVCFSLYCFHLPAGWSGRYAAPCWPTSRAISVRERHLYEINVQISKEAFFILSICLLLSWESFQEASSLFVVQQKLSVSLCPLFFMGFLTIFFACCFPLFLLFF